MCASETLKRSCEKKKKKKPSPARTERAQRVAVRLHTHTKTLHPKSRDLGGEREGKKQQHEMFTLKKCTSVGFPHVKHKTALHFYTRERERVNVEAHTYRSASRRWGLVTCVIAVRALSHSQPRRLKPCVSVHFCFVFF